MLLISVCCLIELIVGFVLVLYSDFKSDYRGFASVKFWTLYIICLSGAGLLYIIFHSQV